MNPNQGESADERRDAGSAGDADVGQAAAANEGEAPPAVGFGNPLRTLPTAPDSKAFASMYAQDVARFFVASGDAFSWPFSDSARTPDVLADLIEGRDYWYDRYVTLRAQAQEKFAASVVSRPDAGPTPVPSTPMPAPSDGTSPAVATGDVTPTPLPTPAAETSAGAVGTPTASAEPSASGIVSRVGADTASDSTIDDNAAISEAWRNYQTYSSKVDEYKASTGGAGASGTTSVSKVLTSGDWAAASGMTITAGDSGYLNRDQNAAVWVESDQGTAGDAYTVKVPAAFGTPTVSLILLPKDHPFGRIPRGRTVSFTYEGINPYYPKLAERMRKIGQYLGAYDSVNEYLTSGGEVPLDLPAAPAKANALPISDAMRHRLTSTSPDILASIADLVGALSFGIFGGTTEQIIAGITGEDVKRPLEVVASNPGFGAAIDAARSTMSKRVFIIQQPAADQTMLTQGEIDGARRKDRSGLDAIFDGLIEDAAPVFCYTMKCFRDKRTGRVNRGYLIHGRWVSSAGGSGDVTAYANPNQQDADRPWLADSGVAPLRVDIDLPMEAQHSDVTITWDVTAFSAPYDLSSNRPYLTLTSDAVLQRGTTAWVADTPKADSASSKGFIAVGGRVPDLVANAVLFRTDIVAPTNVGKEPITPEMGLQPQFRYKLTPVDDDGRRYTMARLVMPDAQGGRVTLGIFVNRAGTGFDLTLPSNAGYISALEVSADNGLTWRLAGNAPGSTSRIGVRIPRSQTVSNLRYVDGVVMWDVPANGDKVYAHLPTGMIDVTGLGELRVPADVAGSTIYLERVYQPRFGASVRGALTPIFTHLGNHNADRMVTATGLSIAETSFHGGILKTVTLAGIDTAYKYLRVTGAGETVPRGLWTRSGDTFTAVFAAPHSEVDVVDYAYAVSIDGSAWMPVSALSASVTRQPAATENVQIDVLPSSLRLKAATATVTWTGMTAGEHARIHAGGQVIDLPAGQTSWIIPESLRGSTLWLTLVSSSTTGQPARIDTFILNTALRKATLAAEAPQYAADVIVTEAAQAQIVAEYNQALKAWTALADGDLAPATESEDPRFRAVSAGPAMTMTLVKALGTETLTEFMRDFYAFTGTGPASFAAFQGQGVNAWGLTAQEAADLATLGRNIMLRKHAELGGSTTTTTVTASAAMGVMTAAMMAFAAFDILVANGVIAVNEGPRRVYPVGIDRLATLNAPALLSMLTMPETTFADLIASVNDTRDVLRTVDTARTPAELQEALDRIIAGVEARTSSFQRDQSSSAEIDIEGLDDQPIVDDSADHSEQPNDDSVSDRVLEEEIERLLADAATLRSPGERDSRLSQALDLLSSVSDVRSRETLRARVQAAFDEAAADAVSFYLDLAADIFTHPDDALEQIANARRAVSRIDDLARRQALTDTIDAFVHDHDFGADEESVEDDKEEDGESDGVDEDASRNLESLVRAALAEMSDDDSPIEARYAARERAHVALSGAGDPVLRETLSRDVQIAERVLDLEMRALVGQYVDAAYAGPDAMTRPTLEKAMRLADLIGDSALRETVAEEVQAAFDDFEVLSGMGSKSSSRQITTALANVQRRLRSAGVTLVGGIDVTRLDPASFELAELAHDAAGSPELTYVEANLVFDSSVFGESATEQWRRDVRADDVVIAIRTADLGNAARIVPHVDFVTRYATLRIGAQGGIWRLRSGLLGPFWAQQSGGMVTEKGRDDASSSNGSGSSTPESSSYVQENGGDGAPERVPPANITEDRRRPQRITWMLPPVMSFLHSFEVKPPTSSDPLAIVTVTSSTPGCSATPGEQTLSLTWTVFGMCEFEAAATGTAQSLPEVKSFILWISPTPQTYTWNPSKEESSDYVNEATGEHVIVSEPDGRYDIAEPSRELWATWDYPIYRVTSGSCKLKADVRVNYYALHLMAAAPISAIGPYLTTFVLYLHKKATEPLLSEAVGQQTAPGVWTLDAETELQSISAMLAAAGLTVSGVSALFRNGNLPLAAKALGYADWLQLILDIDLWVEGAAGDRCTLEMQSPGVDPFSRHVDSFPDVRHVRLQLEGLPVEQAEPSRTRRASLTKTQGVAATSRADRPTTGRRLRALRCDAVGETAQCRTRGR